MTEVSVQDVVISGCDRCGCAWASLACGINGWHLLCVPCFDEVYRLTRRSAGYERP
jgi:hypothetical protein